MSDENEFNDLLQSWDIKGETIQKLLQANIRNPRALASTAADKIKQISNNDDGLCKTHSILQRCAMKIALAPDPYAVSRNLVQAKGCKGKVCCDATPFVDDQGVRIRRNGGGSVSDTDGGERSRSEIQSDAIPFDTSKASYAVGPVSDTSLHAFDPAAEEEDEDVANAFAQKIIVEDAPIRKAQGGGKKKTTSTIQSDAIPFNTSKPSHVVGPVSEQEDEDVANRYAQKADVRRISELGEALEQQ